MKKAAAIVIIFLIVIAGCQNAAPAAEQGQITTENTPPAPPPAATDIPEPPATQPADPTSSPTEPTGEAAAEPSPEPVPEAEQPQPITPIEVTYFTPSQQEGPYYPVEKLVEQDNDLITLAGQSAAPAGTPLFFGGFVYDAAGMPLEGITVEIWQTDSSGAYLHPNDPSTDNRDRNFQFYGEAVTRANGYYDFRTLMPGKYEPRPIHIHVKVRADDQYLLTTQFYFANDPSLDLDRLAGSDAIHLVMEVAEGEDDLGNPILVGERDIVLSVELPAYYPAATGSR